MALGKSLKTENKWKVGVGKSRVSSGDVRTLVSKEAGFGRSKKVRSEEIEGNDVPYAGGRKADKEGINEKNNAKSEVNQLDRNRGFKAVNSDGKRKRIYADHSNDEERVFRTPNRKFSSEMRPYKLHEENRKIQYFGRESKNKATKSLDWKNSRAMVRDKDEEVCGFRSGNSNRSARSNSGVENQLEHNQTQRAADSAWKSFKKKVESTKSTTDDSRVVDERRKNKKRVKIRIDPHDLSNKRLDDGVSINSIVKQKKEDPETNNVELSKNAQFRAIRPSPSILSFVEDNFLGRRREIDFRRAGYNIELSAPLDNIPFSTSTEREKIEEPAFRNKLTFFAAAKVSSSFPPPDLPEIAFAGRSNVGKSSLLNSLTRQWGVARTSDKPGLTQTINFFNLGSKICLVDLPGYGFAYAKEEVKEAWEDLVKEYVSTRVGLKRVCLLVDTKWGMKPRDIELIDLMERSQTKYQIVLTKTDTVFPIDVARRAMQIEESLKEKKAAVQPVMMVSSKTGAGVRILRTALTKIARFIKP